MNIVCSQYSLVPYSYFLDEMIPYELNDVCGMVEYKNREAWEMLRAHACISIAPHCKKLDIKEVLPFPWDEKEEKDTSISNEDIKHLRELSEKISKEL